MMSTDVSAPTNLPRTPPTLYFRAQAFHLLLLSPVVVLFLVFFGFPLVSMLVGSFRDGPKGLEVSDEVARPSGRGSRVTFAVSHIPLAGDYADLEAQTVRSLPIRLVDSQKGLIVIAEDPRQGEALFVSYNRLEDEFAETSDKEPRVVRVKKGPIRDRNGDGTVAADDVSVKAEREIEVTSVDQQRGVFTIARPLEAQERVLVSYRYRHPISIAQYLKVFSSGFYWDWKLWRPSVFRSTFEIATFTTLGCVLIGYLLAYFLANTSDFWRALLIPLVVIPFWTSVLVRTFAWVVILGRTGFVNYVFQNLGIIDEPLPMLFNRFAVYVGMIHFLLPYVVLPSFAVMRGIPEHPLKAAASLGASPLMAFFKVYLPLSLPGVGAGALLVFILSLGFFVTPAILGGPGDRMVSNFIETSVNTLDWEFGSALAFLLVLPTAFLYLFYARIIKVEGLYGMEYERLSLPGINFVWRRLARLLSWASAEVRILGRAVRPLAKRFVWRRWAMKGGALPYRIRLSILGLATLLILPFLATRIYQAPRLLITIALLFVLSLVAIAAFLSRLIRVPFPRLVLALLSALVLIFLILPNLIVIPMSFSRHPVFLSFPGQGFTLENFASFLGIKGAGHFERGGWLTAAVTSLQVALAVVLTSVPLGSLAAYGLLRGRFPGKSFVTYLIIAPLIVPTLITAISLFMFFSRYMRFMIGSAVNLWRVQLPLGFIVGHSLLAIPYVVVIVSATLRGIDPIIENAAMSLGANRWVVLRRVIFPLIIPGVVASAFFAFLTSFDELVIAIFLSTPGVTTLPKRMWDGVRYEVDPTVTAISTILVFLTVLVLSGAALTQWYFGRRRYE